MEQGSVRRFMIWTRIHTLCRRILPGCSSRCLFFRRHRPTRRPQQMDWCENKDYAYLADLQLNGCTALIQSGRWSGNDLALIFNNRGNAYSDKNDYDRAIADFSQAIRLDPKYAFPYDGRGKAYYGKNDLNRAFADFSQAIRLDPKYASPYNDRANVYYDNKDYDRAIADYDLAIRLESRNWLRVQRPRQRVQR